VRQYNKLGLLTVGEICRRLCIGQTTYYRYEGKLYPEPKRKGKIRVFSEAEYKTIKKALSELSSLKLEGSELMTTLDICKRLKICPSTYYRYEGTLYPKAKRENGRRSFNEKNIELIQKGLLKRPEPIIKKRSN
jgi:hypothetical protein